MSHFFSDSSKRPHQRWSGADLPCQLPGGSAAEPLLSPVVVQRPRSRGLRQPGPCLIEGLWLTCRPNLIPFGRDPEGKGKKKNSTSQPSKIPSCCAWFQLSIVPRVATSARGSSHDYGYDHMHSGAPQQRSRATCPGSFVLVVRKRWTRLGTLQVALPFDPFLDAPQT